MNRIFLDSFNIMCLKNEYIQKFVQEQAGRAIFLKIKYIINVNSHLKLQKT